MGLTCLKGIKYLLLQSILFSIGIVGIYYGAEWLVKGSSNLARVFGISPLIVGLTVVAFGTSSPELAVSLTAALKESQAIAVGTIIGSNIANIGLVLGITAIIFPLKVERIIMRSELPLMIGVLIIFYLMAMDKNIGFIDGLILFTGIVLFTGYQVYRVLNSRKNKKKQNTEQNINTAGLEKGPGKTKRKHLPINISLIAVGLACLLIGSHLLVKSAIFIAGSFGVSEMVIGLTVVAFGTSIPEMATSVVSAFRKESDICVGNIIGSNIFNILMVIGSVALIKPLNVTKQTIFFDIPIMIIFSLALIPMIRGNLIINRLEGFLLTSGYFIFIFFLFR